MSPSKDPRKPVIPLHAAPVNRRLFLKSSSAAIATAGVAAPAMAQDATPPSASPVPDDTTAAASLPSHPAIEFFNPVEAEMVAALTARILPGTPDDPGAREAGVVYYIDRALAGAFGGGFTVKTYTHGPYLNVSEDLASVESTSRPNIYQVVEVNEENVSRYGFQSILTPQELYRRGLEALAAYCQETYDTPFTELTEQQQDEVVAALAADEATGFEAPSAQAFFSMLRNHTIEGMFADPLYGGNSGMVGWKLIAYPGARGFYTAEELQDPNFHADPVSLADMPNGHGH
jgi:gluconate 2-dehydrogenase gamma chain